MIASKEVGDSPIKGHLKQQTTNRILVKGKIFQPQISYQVAQKNYLFFDRSGET